MQNNINRLETHVDQYKKIWKIIDSTGNNIKQNN